VVGERSGVGRETRRASGGCRSPRGEAAGLTDGDLDLAYCQECRRGVLAENELAACALFERGCMSMPIRRRAASASSGAA
jgi:hypothetical protein